MSISAFQQTCKEHGVTTSACSTTADNFCPPCPETTMMIIRLWKDKEFSTNKANQDGSVVFNPQNNEITLPNKEQLQKLSQAVQDCIFRLFACLEEECLPITKERVITILGDTVVKPQVEAGFLSSQAT